MIQNHYIVIKRKGNMIVSHRHDGTITRNTGFFKIVMMNLIRKQLVLKIGGTLKLGQMVE